MAARAPRARKSSSSRRSRCRGVNHYAKQTTDRFQLLSIPVLLNFVCMLRQQEPDDGSPSLRGQRKSPRRITHPAIHTGTHGARGKRTAQDKGTRNERKVVMVQSSACVRSRGIVSASHDAGGFIDGFGE